MPEVRVFEHYVGIDQMIRDVDQLVEKGDLKPIWRKAVRHPEFAVLLVRLANEEKREAGCP